MTSRERASRRRSPRLIDTDWLVLRSLNQEIACFARECGSDTKIVDYGCGTQPYRALFESRGVGYLGADFKDGDVEIHPDGTVPLPARSTDVVLSFQVLEHVRDISNYFKEIHRLIGKDGKLILSTHGNWLYHAHPSDYRRWTREGLIAELQDNGFMVDVCNPIVGPLAWTTMMKLTSYAYALRSIPVIGNTLASSIAVVLNAKAFVEDKITPTWVTRENACVYFVRARPT